jgi:hypothetical protein
MERRPNTVEDSGDRPVQPRHGRSDGSDAVDCFPSSDALAVSAADGRADTSGHHLTEPTNTTLISSVP